jgi:hypothetical protein
MVVADSPDAARIRRPPEPLTEILGDQDSRPPIGSHDRRGVWGEEARVADHED